MAIAIRRNLVNYRNMEARSVLDNSLCVFCHAIIYSVWLSVKAWRNSIKITYTYTATATYAFIMVNTGFFISHRNSRMRTIVYANLTAYAFIMVNIWFAIAVHIHLTSSASATHTYIFDSTAKAS